MSLSAILLVRNEELHLRRCLENLKGFADTIFAVDCGSTDLSLDILKEYNVNVLFNPWVNYARQFNFALENFEIKTKFVLRLDCDEYLSDDLKMELLSLMSSDEYDAFSVKRKIVFLEKILNYGPCLNNRIIRVWRYSFGSIEDTWMDERLLLKPGCRIKMLNGDLIDHNLNNIIWWSKKHLSYAVREAYDEKLSNLIVLNDVVLVRDGGGKRGKFKYIYRKSPIFIRVLFFFIYNFFFRFGFLDGIKGIIYIFLQTLWYRLVVDIILFEMKFSKQLTTQQLTTLFKKQYDL